MTGIVTVKPVTTLQGVAIEPTARLWPLLDLTGVTLLRWPGVHQLVHVESARAPLAIRIARNVSKTAECWEWTGGGDEDGYATLKVHQVAFRLHRLVWQIDNDVVLADEQVVRHRCDNPPCIRPSHLEPGSDLDNVQDRNSRGRTSRGMAHYAAKLNDGQVREIRRRSAAGELRIALAREFGVSSQLVSRVVLRQVWAELEDA